MSFKLLEGPWLFRHMCLVFVSFTGHLELGPTMTYSFFLYVLGQSASLVIVESFLNKVFIKK